MTDCRPATAALVGAMACLAAACAQTEAPRVTALNRQTHDPHFPIADGPHKDASCDDCHGAFDSFRQFACIGCHKQADVDPIHLGMPGYGYDDASCLTCHPRGVADGSTGGNHDRLFPISQGTKHAGLECVACHTDPTTRKVVTCTACHTHDQATADPKHSTVGGYAYDNAPCLRCHADGQVDRTLQHAPVLIMPSTVPHYRSECLTCHPGSRTDKPWGADFAGYDCLACHPKTETDAQHAAAGAVAADYAYDNASCVICHPTGDRTGTVDHTNFFPIGLGSKHYREACGGCHVNASDRKEIDCTNCHVHTQLLMDAAHTAAEAFVGGYLFQSPLCLRCHAESQVDRVQAHGPFLIRFGAMHDRQECLKCHPRTRASKPWAADFAPYDCLVCHDRTRMGDVHSGEPTYQYQSSVCLGCHPSGGNQ